MDSILVILCVVCLVSFLIGWSFALNGESTIELVIASLSLFIAGVTFFAFIILIVVDALFLNQSGIIQDQACWVISSAGPFYNEFGGGV